MERHTTFTLSEGFITAYRKGSPKLPFQPVPGEDLTFVMEAHPLAILVLLCRTPQIEGEHALMCR